MRRTAPSEAGLRADGEVRTLVADDHASFREVLHELVAATPGFSLVGEASCAEDLLPLVETMSPQLVVMDVCMPGMGGVEGARRLAHLHPEVMVVLISVHGPELLPPTLVAEADAAVFVPKQELDPRLLSELWREHQQA
jgi:DNA-binding NarL/FixJ family response regulator